MPFKDPAFQEKPKATDQFGNRALTEQLELLTHIGTNLASNRTLLADAGTRAAAEAPKVQISAQRPLYIDPKHDQEIFQILGQAAIAYLQKPFEECKPEERAEVLLRAIGDPEFFHFQYVRSGNEIPKLAENTYTTRSGNCDELARIFLAIASKPEFGLADMSQFYVMYKSEATGKEFAHTAIFYVHGKVFFIDPSLTDFKPYDKTFKSPDEVMRDKRFRTHLYELAASATGEKGPFQIEEMARVKGTGSWGMSYYFNYGDYAIQTNDWDTAIECYSKVLSMGLATAQVYAALGQAHVNTESGDRMKHYQTAEDLLTKAIAIRPDARYYANRGYARFQLGNYELASHDFEMQLKSMPNKLDALVSAGSAYVNIACSHINDTDYSGALAPLKKAQGHLFDALRLSSGSISSDLSNNLEAFFTNYHTVLTNIGKKSELADMHRLYLEAQKLGYRSEAVDSLFK